MDITGILQDASSIRMDILRPLTGISVRHVINDGINQFINDGIDRVIYDGNACINMDPTKTGGLIANGVL
ncbi:hypothetical protein E2562_005968 [Oryza meyeriana var. granulata]|uniref:Uncharacterized protein n=1 Tax=Oryza meyeriana var. granulata TaxID=110450 RepID=A0A6G1DXH1_9ORYZ|nr:hypothetical protein E2562_005968 [Oryza meyeriana var. granulata]